MFWFFGGEACGILAPWPGIKPAPPALEGEVFTTGPPGKSPNILKSGKVLPKAKKAHLWAECGQWDAWLNTCVDLYRP